MMRVISVPRHTVGESEMYGYVPDGDDGVIGGAWT